MDVKLDLSGLVQAFLDALNQWLTALNQSAIDTVQDDLTQFIAWLKATNFITRTPTDLVNALSDLIGLNQIVPLLNALTGTALLFAAVAYAGHYVFGWPGINATLSRIGIGIMLVKISQQLTDWSLQMFDGMSQGIAVNMPDNPNLSGANWLGVLIAEAFWVILFARVAWVAAKRIAWLAMLKPLAGLAFIAYMFPKAAWITSMWVELWVGWLVGQLLMILCIALAIQFVRIGGFAGYLLSCAALGVAHDAVSILTPKGGPPLVSVGPVKLG